MGNQRLQDFVLAPKVHHGDTERKTEGIFNKETRNPGKKGLEGPVPQTQFNTFLDCAEFSLGVDGNEFYPPSPGFLHSLLNALLSVLSVSPW